MDNPRSYGVAHREVMPFGEHRQPMHLDNRAGNNHQPARQRQRAVKGFRDHVTGVVGTATTALLRMGLEPATPWHAIEPACIRNVTMSPSAS